MTRIIINADLCGSIRESMRIIKLFDYNSGIPFGFHSGNIFGSNSGNLFGSYSDNSFGLNLASILCYN
jgi:hypothetical protein